MNFLGISRKKLLVAGISLALGSAMAYADDVHEDKNNVFNRISTFPVYLNTDVDIETIAEIVDVSEDGMTLVYTDGEGENIGFVDITNPAKPLPAGTIAVGGEPTSVAVAGQYALVAVNTSPSFIAPAGVFHVIDIKTHRIVTSFPLNGQPDSVAVSPDGTYAAVVIENERDEDLGNGEPPQTPGGNMLIVNLTGEPAEWTLRAVNFNGIPDLFPGDPEPEYVDINERNIAVVSFQENNYLALVDLKTGAIINHFTAGTVDLAKIDTREETPALISLTDFKTDTPREPDGVTWINKQFFATADEGDLFGGSRGISVFNSNGKVVFNSGNTLDHTVVRMGHYPDGRSGNKGNEPENVEFARFGKNQYLFVASERSHVIFVYQVNGKHFELKQTLPAGVRPEGIKAIPNRGLLVATGEKDDRGAKFRGGLTIYELQNKKATYPTIISKNRTDGTPIPWAALSGLAVDRHNDAKAYSIQDSFYQQSRIFKMNIKKRPAVITGEIVLNDSLGKLTSIDPLMVNGDGTVNLDPEGITTSDNGGFWLASEGAGTVGDTKLPFVSFDLLLHVTDSGAIDEVVMLPDTTNKRQVRFGFEGVTSVGKGDDEVLYVAFQREWADDPTGYARIGRYDTSSKDWSFYYYPLDVPESPNGGWVGLSEITALGNNEFAVIERDNQANTDARIKKIYKFTLDGLMALSDPVSGVTPVFPVINKSLMYDLIPMLESTGGMVLEKIEGLAITRKGDMILVNDNDGVDDSNGETQLIHIKNKKKNKDDHEGNDD